MATFFYANDNYNSNLSAGFTAGETTMSVLTVPTNVPTIVCLGYGTDKECVYSVTGKTSNSLTGVARVSGYNGNLDSQMTIACLNNDGFINQMAAVVSSPETLADNIYGADGGGTDAYEISLDSPPSAYVTGMFILFRANTANTGAASLNVNSLGAKAIKKNGAIDLGTNDILAGQIVGVVYAENSLHPHDQNRHPEHRDETGCSLQVYLVLLQERGKSLRYLWFMPLPEGGIFSCRQERSYRIS